MTDRLSRQRQMDMPQIDVVRKSPRVRIPANYPVKVEQECVLPILIKSHKYKHIDR